ncbi:MAG TPA: chemotaxis protein CheW, partial [Burkholderiaceae bacterium]|nr:chemotaxis protein CheW [Burkholderiaceae bacterium]
MPPRPTSLLAIPNPETPAAGAAVSQPEMREYQAQLNERIRQAGSAPDLAARLGLMIGQTRWLVDLSEAGEIVPLPVPILPVPLTRDWLLGLVNLRGVLYALADLQRFRGEAPTDTGKDARLLAFAPRLGFNAAIVVTRMLGLRNVASMRADDAAADGGWVGRLLTDGEGNRWRELNLQRLAADRRFLMVGR